MSRLIGAAALLLVILALAPASAAAAGEDPCPQDSDSGVLGVRLTGVETKAPHSSTWVKNVNGPICVAIVYDSPSTVDLESLYYEEPPPPGTGIRVTLESEMLPLYTTGNYTRGETIFNGHEIVVTGYVFLTELPSYVGDACDAEEKDPLWLGHVALDTGDPGAEAYQGSYFSTNAVRVVPKVIEGGKALSLALDGCGDHNPDTADGYFEGFIPEAAATAIGITPELVESLTPAVAGQLVQVTNNGQPTTAGMSLEAVEGGLFLRYAMSFSKHRIKLSANHKAIALSRHCQKTHGRLKVRRVRHKHRQSRLVCVS